MNNVTAYHFDTLVNEVADMPKQIDLSDFCPACASDNIANEGPESELTCHDCSHQWTDEEIDAV